MAGEKPRSIVLLSGGMDSGVCAAVAARETEAAALHVSYGQRTESRERRAFEQICDRLNIARRMTIRNDVLSRIGGSALTDRSIEVPEVHGEPPQKAKTGRSPIPARQHRASREPWSGGPGIGQAGIPVTYVPFRNAHFLAAAVSWAEILGATRVYIGAVEQDSSGYPDCRPAYYQAFQRVVEAGTRAGGIEIVTPLIALRKSEIVKLGLKAGAPFDLTWSCYTREDKACGVCESCVLRLRAFAEAGSEDPIPYAEPVVSHRM